MKTEKLFLKLFVLTISFFLASLIQAQNVGFNNTGALPNASALVDIDAAPTNNKGILVPRISLTQTTSNAPVGAGVATSLFVYNTASINDVTPGYYYWDGTKWMRLLGADNAWLLLGNAGTTAGTNFLGTTDAQDLVFKTNSTEWMRVLSTGNVGISTATPVNKLDVNGNLALGTYAGTNIAPSNGAIISGRVGVGTNIPLADGVVHIISNLTNSTKWASSNFGANLIIGGLGSARNPAVAFLDFAGTSPFAICNRMTSLTITRMPALGDGVTQDLNDLNIFTSDGHTELGVLAGGNPAFYRNLVVSGKTGLFINPINTLDVNGGTAMGTYAGINTAPVNGAIISGDVGIGTAGPLAKLHVSGGDVFVTDQAINNFSSSRSAYTIRTDNITQASDNGIRLYDGNSNGHIHLGNVGFSYFQSYNTASIGPGTLGTSTLDFDDNANFADLVLNPLGGYVGIGTTSPNSKLTVYHSACTPYGMLSLDAFTFCSVPNSVNSFFIRCRDIASGSPDYFYVQGDGKVGIGTSTPTEALHVIGNICYTGGIAACSDIRYKKDFKPLANSLENVLKINGLNYYWRNEEFKDKKFTSDKQIGFIAQDLEKIYPELVTTDINGYKSVDYSRLTPILVEAIKEQQKIIEAQQSSINNLQVENKNFKAKYDNRLKALEELFEARAQK